jgi:hypothetical protein
MRADPGGVAAVSVTRPVGACWSWRRLPFECRAVGRARFSTAGRTLVFARAESTGAIRSAPGRAACVNRGGRHGCTTARADFQPGQIVEFSTDGSLAYIGPDLFSREASTGALSELPGTATCPFVPGVPPACLPDLLQGAITWRRSPDGEFGYAISRDGISTLQTDAETHLLGRPTRAGPCLGITTLCTPLRGITEPRDIALSADGRSAYITPGGTDPGALVVLDRDPTTGTLRQVVGRNGCLGPRGCLSTPVPYPYSPPLIDPRGRNVYLVGEFIAIFRRSRPTSVANSSASPEGHGLAQRHHDLGSRHVFVDDWHCALRRDRAGSSRCGQRGSTTLARPVKCGCLRKRGRPSLQR